MSVLDYPSVRVVDFERLPIPEALDPLSRNTLINKTPQIARAYDAAAVREYFAWLATTPGREMVPSELLPRFQASSRFRWAYPVEDSGIYLSLTDSDDGERDQRVVEVRVHCDGPNLGSAGGPTLLPLGAIARLRYEGLLAEGFRA